MVNKPELPWARALAELEEIVNEAKAAHARWESERSDVRRTVAAADASRARDLDCLNAAGTLLRCAAAGRRPPRRLRARFTTALGEATYTLQLRRLRQLVPQGHIEKELASSGRVEQDAALEVGRIASQLRLGRYAYAREWTLMEPAVQVGDRPESLKNVPMSAKRGGLRHRWILATATAMQVPDTRGDEADQFWRDRDLVWERSRLYAAAVLALLRTARL